MKCPVCGFDAGDRHECAQEIPSGLLIRTETEWKDADGNQFVVRQDNRRFAFTGIKR